MSDLRTRIVAVQADHVEGQLTNYDDDGREECGCGHQGNATYREHLADAVIRELDAEPEVNEQYEQVKSDPADDFTYACKSCGSSFNFLTTKSMQEFALLHSRSHREGE